MIHSHRCDICDHVWSHGDSSAGNREDHECPECGAIQWLIYHGRASRQQSPAKRFSEDFERIFGV